MSNPPHVLSWLFRSLLLGFPLVNLSLPNYLDIGLNVSLSLVPTDRYLGLSVLNH
jgi:hypothetical protein